MVIVRLCQRAHVSMTFIVILFYKSAWPLSLLYTIHEGMIFCVLNWCKLQKSIDCHYFQETL